MSSLSRSVQINPQVLRFKLRRAMATNWSRAAFITSFVVLSSAASALIVGGSNLGFLGYPDHECYRKPSKPFKPFKFNSQSEVDLYNTQVELYNQQMRRYFRCMEEYLENAGNDIKRIEEKMEKAADEAKRP